MARNHFGDRRRTLPGGAIVKSGPYLGPKSILWALPRSKKCSKAWQSSHTAAKKLFLCARMPCIAISLHISCQNHGITRLPTVKLMIPGGLEPLLGPKADLTRRSDCDMGALLVSKIHLRRPCLVQNNVAKPSNPATQRPKRCSYGLECIA